MRFVLVCLVFSPSEISEFLCVFFFHLPDRTRVSSRLFSRAKLLLNCIGTSFLIGILVSLGFSSGIGLFPWLILAHGAKLTVLEVISFRSSVLCGGGLLLRGH